MTDKELLELAAKAAGLEYTTTEDHDRLLVLGDDKLRRPWDPLTDDGDALRLAVNLGITPQSICYDDDEKLFAAAWLYNEDAVQICYVRETYTEDPYAATRRAITRAAAAIGEGMK